MKLPIISVLTCDVVSELVLSKRFADNLGFAGFISYFDLFYLFSGVRISESRDKDKSTMPKDLSPAGVFSHQSTLTGTG